MNRKEKKKKKRNPLVMFLFLAALAVFVFAGIRLGSIYYRYYNEDSAYRNLESYTHFANSGQTSENGENLSDNANGNANGDSNGESSVYVSPIDFGSLAEINSDIIGWVYFETMDINYPIVQGKDDDFYLHHGFEKEANVSGCIFMDTEASPDFNSLNSFIYGHNMRNKSMFAKLNQYIDEDFYLKNKTFLIYTPTETRRYEIYSCYQAQLGTDSFTYNFAAAEDYANWLNIVKGRSLYDTGVMPDVSDKTITLMTCTPKGSNYRFLVHGRLMR